MDQSTNDQSGTFDHSNQSLVAIVWRSSRMCSSRCGFSYCTEGLQQETLGGHTVIRDEVNLSWTSHRIFHVKAEEKSL